MSHMVSVILFNKTFLKELRNRKEISGVLIPGLSDIECISRDGLATDSQSKE